MWSTRAGVGLSLSTKDASGVYAHTVIDATVPGKGWDYSSLSSNGDAAWLGKDSANIQNIYLYDAVTRVARPLTFYTAVIPGRFSAAPQIGGNGSTAWATFVPLCNGCADGGLQIDYFDKPTSQTIRLNATPNAALSIALNGRGDAYWLERAADGAWELRKFDAQTRTTSTTTRRPAGTGTPSTGFSLAVNDFGDIAWAEVVAGTSQIDLFLFDQRANAVRRITNTPGGKYAMRINAAGSIVWKTENQVWMYDSRSANAVLINAQSDYSAGLALNDMGEVAWSYHPSDVINEMHLHKRATAGDVRVRPGVAYPIEFSPALSGSGELFFVSTWGLDASQGEIVRSTRDFTCN